MTAAHLLVKGRVQGVGFRYFVMQNAKIFGLKGYVKNLNNGDVEIRVEGKKEIIEQFKFNMEQGPAYAAVDRVVTTFEPYSANFKDFSVEY
jgi:acylphosphatase